MNMKKEKTIDQLSNSVVVYSNYYQCESSMIIHNNDVYSRMLLWCESGAGDVTVNGKGYRFSKGSFLILPWRHSITYKADKLIPFNLGGIHLIPYYSPSLTFKTEVAHNDRQIWWKGDSIRDVEIPHLQQITEGRFNEFTKGLERLAAYTIELHHRERFQRNTAGSLAHLLFEEMRYVVESLPVGLKNTESTRFEKITGFIRENLDKEISLRQLGDIGAVSISTLRRLFLRSVGVSPYEWILQARMERARYLLRTTSDPISHIALQTGFEDPSYFVRLFHKKEGLTPHRYRVGAFKI